MDRINSLHHNSHRHHDDDDDDVVAEHDDETDLSLIGDDNAHLMSLGSVGALTLDTGLGASEHDDDSSAVMDLLLHANEEHAGRTTSERLLTPITSDHHTLVSLSQNVTYVDIQADTKPPTGQVNFRTFIRGSSNKLQAITLETDAVDDTKESIHTESRMQTSEPLCESDDLLGLEQPALRLDDVDAEVSRAGPGREVQLEDGSSAFVETEAKDCLHAVHLRDGSVAYITSEAYNQLFSGTLDDPPLSVVQATSKDVSALAAQRFADTPVPTNGTPLRQVNGVWKYVCEVEGCGKLYSTQNHLKVHARSHSGVKPFVCQYVLCRKTFATSYGLKAHIRVHTGEKPYKCPGDGCVKSFKTSGDLQKHVRTHTGERPFKCPFEGCDRSFTTSNIRKVHIRTHTGEKPFKCAIKGCERQFASVTNYRNHMRIHTGERPYVCLVPGCTKRFTEYSSLYKHHIVHTTAKPYTCTICNRTYRQTSTLAMHLRSAHADDAALASGGLVLTDADDAQLVSKGQPAVADEIDVAQMTMLANASLRLVTQFSGDRGSVPVPVNQNVSTTSGLHATPITLTQIGGEVDSSLGQLYLVTDTVQLQAIQAIAAHRFSPDQVRSASAIAQSITTVDGTNVSSTLIGAEAANSISAIETTNLIGSDSVTSVDSAAEFGGAPDILSLVTSS